MKWYIKAIEVLLVLFATLVMVLTIHVIQDANVLGPVAGCFLSIFSAYLGVDMAKMLKETSQRPPGDFKDMQVYRYALSLVIFLGLFVFTYHVGVETGNAMTAALAVFGSGSMLIICSIIGGLGGNKLLTGKKEGN